MSKKVKHPLPLPENCDNCASNEIIFTTNDVIYGHCYSKWPYVYFCKNCSAAVGCHPNTNIPLGKLASALIRKLRAEAHAAFDPIWKSEILSRNDAYCLLAKALEIEREECHISQLNERQLKFVIENCSSEQLQTQLKIFKRRKEKKDEKRAKRIEREKAKDSRFSAYSKKTGNAFKQPRRGKNYCGENS